MGSDYPKPEEILMMVEVVSPSTVTTDRLIKPGEYAHFGIPYYLLVEPDSTGRVVRLTLHENIQNPNPRLASSFNRMFQGIA